MNRSAVHIATIARHHARLFGSIVAAALFMVTGCAPQQAAEAPESPPAGWPEALSDFSMTWTGEPGIDLTSDPAVVVRAYIESYYLARATDDERYLYPGFAQSVDANNPDGVEGTKELWPSADRPREWIGDFRQHILRVEQSEQNVVVFGCMYTYDSGIMQGPEIDRNTEPGPYGVITALRVGLEAPRDGNTPDSQAGPSRAPSENVFGEWHVTNHQGGYLLTSEWPDRGRDIDECRTRADGTPESRQFVPARAFTRSDFPAMPPNPGWPADLVTATS